LSVVLITGAATGIGNLTARALAVAGHTVFASVRSLEGSNASHARELRETAERDGTDLRVLELDVRSQASADAAVAHVVEAAGRLDVVVHNAGHLFVGYVEAFSAEEVAALFDINAVGLQRVNRAALPHLRERRAGTLVYVSSTSPVSMPPFLGPYVASKAAFDVLAHTTAYEVGRFGIETVIVVPGPFTQGTDHFPNASHAGDEEVTRAYAELDGLVARNEEATSRLFPPDEDADPRAVAEEITRVLALPFGEKPFRTVIDFTHSGVEDANAALAAHRDGFLTRMGFEELQRVRR
jgi:NAD(P)-dependent dehydrogenase (short-subunit alcohol dehydrogenase family)